MSVIMSRYEKQPARPSKSKLGDRLVRYSATAGAALALAPAAEGVVIKTQINQTLSVGDPLFNISMDGNGNQFAVQLIQSSYFYATSFLADAFTLTSNAEWVGGNFFGTVGSIVQGVYGLSYNFYVSSFGPQWNQVAYPSIPAGNLAFTPPTSDNGQFDVSGVRYMGVRFDIGGNLHYGWVGLDLAPDLTSLTITEVAYNDTPGQGIFTGTEIPEPGHAAVGLGLLALGAAGVLRHRRQRAEKK